MRELVRVLVLVTFVLLGAAVGGCGGGGKDEVLEYNPEESKRQGAAYEEEMKEAMKNQPMRGQRPPVPGGRR